MKPNPMSLLAALTMILLASPVGAGDLFSGQLSVGGGYSAHPLGIDGDEDAGYASQTLRLQLNKTLGSSAWRLGYEGSAHEFTGEQSLDQMHHALGLEWFGSAADHRWNLSAGAQASGRMQSGIYQPYDFVEATGYFAFKTYLRDGLLARGYAQVRDRSYSELPEESFSEPSVQVDLQRFLPSQTTLGATLGWGWKLFRDPAAERVWETDGMPSTHLLRLQLNAAQSLSDRVSLR
ncbi:MAG: hypothetical protein KC729_21600, partial [Candidatus Eisenbacteria bacterium]|nr:hypothetical protein [Candidatus Eisenbacteria bacterium]